MFNHPTGGLAHRGVKAALLGALGAALLWQGAADMQQEGSSLLVASSAVSGGCALLLGVLCFQFPALYASAAVNIVEVAFIYVLLTLNWALHHSQGVVPLDQRLVLAAHLLIGALVREGRRRKLQITSLVGASVTGAPHGCAVAA